MIHFCVHCKKFAVFRLSQGLCSRKRCQRQYELGPALRRLSPRSVGVGGSGGEGEEGRPDLSATATSESVAGVE